MIRTVSRCLATGCAALTVLIVTTLTMAAPAMAEASEYAEKPPPIDPVHAILILAGIPLLITVVLAVGVYLPSMLRGESLALGGATAEDAWLGGPRRPAGELTGVAPGDGQGDDVANTSGGAGTTW